VTVRIPTDPARRDRPEALHVVTILPTLNPYGGVVSVMNLLEHLTALGNRSTLASLSGQMQDSFHAPFEPMHVPDQAALPSELPADGDVVLATSWETVKPACAYADRTGAHPVYFVQDIESEFYADGATRQAALATYARIATRVVKTRFLQERLHDLGYAAHRIPPGMDLDVFYPRDVRRRPGRVLAMARPTESGADHRGFDILIRVFERLAADRPEVDLVTFGHDDPSAFPVQVTTFARRSSHELAELYSSASVFVDTSRHHGFGRTGVEAMACGAAAVLSRSGGIDEYARDGETALTVPVGDVDSTVQAIVDLLDDAALRSRLAEQGRRTVAAFDDRVAARALLDVFHSATSAV
jgi:glycosyltransferase involved in cell wall biosynthesis